MWYDVMMESNVVLHTGAKHNQEQVSACCQSDACVREAMEPQHEVRCKIPRSCDNDIESLLLRSHFPLSITCKKFGM